MKNAFKSKKYLVLAGLLVISITAVAWQIDNKKKTDTATSKYTTGDTTEPKQRNNDQDEFRMNELEDAIKKLDAEMQKLDLHMKALDVQLSKELEETMDKIDFEKMGKQIEEQMKKIDVDKIKKDINNSIQQSQNQLKQIDMQKLHNEMLELQQNFNSDKFKKQINSAMKDAKHEMEKAMQELQELKEFTGQLEKDGLINKKKGYSIEWKKEGDLYINGKKQPREVSDKYSRFYKKDGYKIRMSGDDENDGESL